jgi:hypothetical protein
LRLGRDRVDVRRRGAAMQSLRAEVIAKVIRNGTRSSA